MKTQAKAAEPVERGEVQILAAIDAQNVALVAARIDIDKLRSQRRGSLVSADLSEISQIDAKIGRGQITVEIAEAQVAALEIELEALYAAKRKARIDDDMAQVQRLAAKERELICVYEEAAARAAAALIRMGPIHSEMSRLNANLPTRVEAVGTHLTHAAKLPGRGHSDDAFWPPRYRVPIAGEAA
jgi:hypothetical protein